MSSLHGKKIIITRPRHQSEEFVQLLKREEADSIILSMIEIIPPESWEECDKAIERLNTYDAVIFSSSNAVENFFQRTHEKDIEILKDRIVYVVGEKTAAAVSKLGVTPVAPPDVHDGEHLAEKIVANGVKGKRFLLPKGNIGRATVKDQLLMNSAEVDDVIFYRTVAPSKTETEKIIDMLHQKKVDAVTFFSPSSIENCVSVIPVKLLSQTTIAVIGKTAAEAAAHFGLTVHVTAEPSTSEGMVEALKRFFTQI